VHGRQGAGAGPFLRLRRARAVRAFGTGKDAARGEDQDVAVGEFLLELAGETARRVLEVVPGMWGLGR